MKKQAILLPSHLSISGKNLIMGGSCYHAEKEYGGLNIYKALIVLSAPTVSVRGFETILLFNYSISFCSILYHCSLEV